jgi:hypothetical protein
MYLRDSGAPFVSDTHPEFLATAQDLSWWWPCDRNSDQNERYAMAGRATKAGSLGFLPREP